MLSETLEKFGYPESLVGTHGKWHVLMRPGQVTLGSLVLICNEQVESLGDISPRASSELREVSGAIERVLASVLAPDKLNYLALMMVDPEVHFHVLPRHAAPVELGGAVFEDVFWPGPAEITSALEITASVRAELLERLRAAWVKDLPVRGGRVRKYSRLYTTGCFDIFHHGHLNILKRSKAMCDYLIVGVSTDELVEKEKGRRPIIPFNERVSVVSALSEVDEVIAQTDKDKQRIVDQYRIDAISVGSDWKGRYPEVTCEMEYIDYTPDVSSTVLKDTLGLNVRPE